MNKPRILVVEDEALIAANLVNVLTSLGYMVPEPVATGEDAIRAVKTQKPDLVLMDIVLIGEMNGIVAAEKIRAIADIPLVYLTAYTDDLHLKQAQLTEPYGYIIKPADSRELRATIEMVLYRHALDRKLKESEDKYRTVFENTGTAMVIVEESNIIILANKEFAHLTGFSKDDIEGKKRWTEFVVKEDLERMLAQHRLRRQNRKKALTHYEFRAVTKSGDIRTICLSIDMIPGTTKSVASLMDITERKQAEEALQESERKFHEIFNNVNDAIHLHEIREDGHPGKFIDVNDVACQILQYSRDEMLQHTPLDFATDYHNRPVDRIMEELITVGHAVFETGHKRKDGAIIPVEINAHKITLMGKKVILSVVRDITERKQAEESLNKMMQQLKFHVDNTPLAVIEFDRNFRIVRWSGEAERMFGWGGTEVIGKRIDELHWVHDDDIQRVADISAEMISGKKLRNIHTNRNYHKDGSVLICEWYNSALLDATGKLISVFSFVLNITDRKLAEKQIKDSEARFKDLFNNMSAGVAVYEAVGDGDDFIFRDINNAAEKIDKVRREDAVGRSVLEIFPGVKEYGLFDVFQRVWRTGVPEQHPISQYRDNRISGWRDNYVYKLPSGEIVAIYEDVTDKKLAEEALRETEETFKAVAENANDGILIAVGEGAHTFANRRASEITGYSIAELLKTSIMDLAAPDEVKNLMEKFRKRLSGKDVSQQYETVIIRKDGKSVTIEFTAAKTLWHGQPADLVIIRDITERKQAEEALQENQKRFQALTETTNDFVWEMDANGVYTYCSPQINELWGYKPEDMIGRSPFDLMIPEDRKNAIKMFRTISESPISFKGMETSSLDNTGRIVVLETSGVPFFDIDGRLCGYRGISRDITARKQAEVALHESEERYSILADAEHDTIYSVNPEGVVTFVNSGGAALIGMPPEKIVGLSLESLYDPDSAEEFRENLDRVISTKRPVRYDTKFWHENQDKITWLDAQLVPQLGPDGSVVQVIGISRSITDRKQAEMLLKRFNIELEWQVRLRTAELEHTNSLLEAAIIQRTLAEESIRKSLNERELLLREIHHRVKNNLQIILSLISLQSRNIKDQKVLDTMGEFQNRIMAMAHVHERMCRADDISRIDLSEIVTFLGASLFKSYKVNPQHIRLNVEMQDLQITIDSAIPISLIINELVSNSIKHAFPKGTMGEITIAGRREADKLVLSVRDTGIGIPADIDWMRSKQSLGHRLVVSLVEQLQGTIELDRTTGTVFNIVVKEKQ